MKARLFLLAHGRSGDKGNSVNIGVIARKPEWYAFINAQLTAAKVAKYLKPLASGPVEKFELPNLEALNFLVQNALDGGGSLSLRLDAQGKTYAQAIMRYPLDIPDAMAAEIKKHWGKALPADCVIEEGASAKPPAMKPLAKNPSAKKASTKKTDAKKKPAASVRAKSARKKPARK